MGSALSSNRKHGSHCKVGSQPNFPMEIYNSMHCMWDYRSPEGHTHYSIQRASLKQAFSGTLCTRVRKYGHHIEEVVFLPRKGKKQCSPHVLALKANSLWRTEFEEDEENTVRRTCKPREGPTTLHKTLITLVQRACRQEGGKSLKRGTTTPNIYLQLNCPPTSLLIVRTEQTAFKLDI